MCNFWRKKKDIHDKKTAVGGGGGGGGKKKSKKNKKKSPASPSPTISASDHNSTRHTVVSKLLEQGLLKEQYMQELEAMKQNYASYYREYRQAYRNESVSLNSLTNEKFTEIICLPTDECKTVEDVLQSKEYTVEKKIGKGGYGVVYRGKFNGQSVAIKTINLRKGNRQRMMNHLKTEIYIMERFPHPNIITLLDHFIIDDTAYIVMEFANGGSLADLIENNGPLDEDTTYEYFVQMLKGLFYLHTFNMAHRDIKLDNVLLLNVKNDTSNQPTKVVKLTDFGLSQDAYRPKEGRIKTGNFGGTRSYMAPEIIRLEVFEDFDEEDSLDYDPFKADIWAMGVCLYEMLCNTLPFDCFNKDMDKLFDAQLNRKWTFPPDIRSKLSADVKNLIKLMLEPNANCRIDPFGIWMHSWIQRCYMDHAIRKQKKDNKKTKNSSK